MIKETVGDHIFLLHKTLDGYFFEIQSPIRGRIISQEIFESPGRARLAAIGQISLIEKGDSHGDARSDNS